MRQNTLDNSLLLSNETINIPSSRTSCNVNGDHNAFLSAIPDIKVYFVCVED
jgi:hypothetical protein